MRGTTYENRAHLAASFFDRIVTKYEGTRLGQQELLAEILEVSEGAWFPSFDVSRHVTDAAEYDAGAAGAPGDRLRGLPARGGGLVPGAPVRYVPAGCPSVRAGPPSGLDAAAAGPAGGRARTRSTVTVFGDFHCEGLYSEAAARAIVAHGATLPGCGGRADRVRLDPAASARTGIGPTAYAEFERVFGPKSLAKWPLHGVLDGLDQLEVLLDQGCLLLHPRCVHLKAAFQNYTRRRSAGGNWLDEPSTRSPPRGLDGCVAGRGPGQVARGPDRAAAAADRPGGEGVRGAPGRWQTARGRSVGGSA